MHEYHARRRVEFADTDMAGLCHFARFFIFVETAEHQLLASLGVNLIQDTPEGRICWPRVSVSCEYLSPARFGDLLDIHLHVVRKGRTSLTWAFDVSRDGTPVACGRVTTVCCVLSPQGTKPIPIPPPLAEQLEEAP